MVYNRNRMKPDPQFATVREIAFQLQVHWQTVHNYIKSGELHAFKMGNGYRVHEDEIERFIEARRVIPIKKQQKEKKK